MNTVYLSSAYLAPVQYYARLFNSSGIYIEKECNYVKQTYRNRCDIGGPNGKHTLSIPIVKPDTLKCPTRDIRISSHGNWRHTHWNAIESAYNSTPFFEYYKDDFIPFFEKQYEFLFDMNEELRALICDLLDINTKIEYTTEYISSENISGTDLREIIHPKKDYREYDPDFFPLSYYQVFANKHGFLPNLSIIDLLFNMGPETILILNKCLNK